MAETGQIDIRLTIRSAAREIAPSSPRYFDRVYFGGADQGMNLTLGRRTTLKPIFLPHPCEGSTVRFADVAAHRVRQIDLIGALKQMFNLCFYSDALTARSTSSRATISTATTRSSTGATGSIAAGRSRSKSSERTCRNSLRSAIKRATGRSRAGTSATSRFWADGARRFSTVSPRRASESTPIPFSRPR